MQPEQIPHRSRVAMGAQVLRSISLLSCLLVSAPLQADPVQEAHYALSIASSHPFEAELRLLQLAIAYPEERVLLVAARWPWHRVRWGSSKLLPGFLRSRIADFPELAAYFGTLLDSKVIEEQQAAIEVLSPLIGQRLDLRMRLQELSKDDRLAGHTLEHLLAQSPSDLHFFLSILAEGHQDSPRRLTYAIRVLTSHFAQFPQARQAILKLLETTQSEEIREEVLASIDPATLNDPDLFAQIVSLMNRPITNETATLADTLVALVLNHFPNHKIALDSLIRLVQFLYSHGHAVPWTITFRSAKLAKFYLERCPALASAVEQGGQDLLKYLRTSPHPRNPSTLSDLFPLYLEVLLKAGRLTPAKVEDLATTLHPSELEEIRVALVLMSHELPYSMDRLIQEAGKNIGSVAVLSQLAQRTPINKQAHALIVRDVRSGGEGSLHFLSGALHELALSDPSALEPLWELALDPKNSDREVYSSLLLGADPYLGFDQRGGLEWAVPLSADPETASSRRLLSDPNPPLGWLQVIRSILYQLNDDPLRLRARDQGIEKLAKAGWKARENALALAQERLEAKGMVFHPSAHFIRAINFRRTQMHPTANAPISAAQRRLFEQRAASRLYSEYPWTTADERQQDPFTRIYRGFIRELELTEKGNEAKLSGKQSHGLSETWRANSIDELQRLFRAGLKAILRSGPNTIVLEPTRQRLTEDDLAHIHLLPEPATNRLGRSVELNGVSYGLVLAHRNSGEEGCSLETTKRDMGEVATLTLGPAFSSTDAVAEEALKGRIFAYWLGAFQNCLQTLQSASLHEMRSALAREVQGDSETYLLAKTANGPNRVLLSLLWEKVVGAPNYWRDREALALARGNTDWRVEMSPRYQGIFEGAPRGEAMKRPDRGAVSSGLAGVVERLRPSNTVIADLPNYALFRVEPRNKKPVPHQFTQDYSETPGDRALYGPSPNRPIASDHTEFVLHTEQVRMVGSLGWVGIPRASSAESIYSLRSLEVFSGRDGQRLEPGADKDYQLLENPKTGGLAIVVNKPGIATVLFSAGFARDRRRSRATLPLLAVDRIRALIEPLRNAGLSRLAAGLEDLLARPRNREKVSIDALADVFHRSSYYASGSEKGLGEINTPLQPGNPFADYRRFVDAYGLLCFQCDGANTLFAEFLALAIGPASGIEVGTQFLYSRTPGHWDLSARDWHLVTFVRLPGLEDPIEIDVTPRTRFSLFSGWWSEKRKQTVTLPLWRVHLSTPTQVQSPPAPESIPAKTASTTDERSVRIEEAVAALTESIKEAQKRKTLPRRFSWDKTEPAYRSLFLARHALAIINASHGLPGLVESLRIHSPWFSKQNISDPREALAAIARFAQAGRRHLVSYIRRLPAGTYRFCNEPEIQDRIEHLYRQIEAVAECSEQLKWEANVFEHEDRTD